MAYCGRCADCLASAAILLFGELKPLKLPAINLRAFSLYTPNINQTNILSLALKQKATRICRFRNMCWLNFSRRREKMRNFVFKNSGVLLPNLQCKC